MRIAELRNNPNLPARLDSAKRVRRSGLADKTPNSEFQNQNSLYELYNMRLIVGLGNPGKDYSGTRHNLGFMVIEAIASKYSIPLKSKTKNIIFGAGTIKGIEVLLAKPLTFMNRSGVAVREALRKCEDADSMIVVHDDLDLNTGVLKIKKNGSAGGHNGVESIIEILGTKNFPRVKMGIGKPDKKMTVDYVLNRFHKSEKPLIKEAIENAVTAVEMILSEGLIRTQNKFNKSV